MKSSTLKGSVQDVSFQYRAADFENSQKQSNNPLKAVTTMHEQFVTPPSHIWDRIEAILDEQESSRKISNPVLATTFNGDSKPKSKKKQFATLAGLSLVTGLVLLLS